MKTLFGFVSALLLATLSLHATDCMPCSNPPPSNPSGFVIHRGTNLSHWLSQDFGWFPRSQWLTKNDLRFIASQGFDHVRLPIDEHELWNEDGTPKEDAFALLTSAIGWAREEGLRIILDMHVLRSHHFNAVNEDGMKANTLFGDPAAQQHLADLWVELSHRYGQIPVSELAYEIMNEPVADDHEDWNKLVALVFAQIRAIEPDRVIVIGANRWQIPSNVPYLKFPEGDKNIIISFHTYSPMLLTHYKAEWTPLRIYEGPVNYPGAIITPEAVIELKADLRGAGAGDENADEFAEVWGPERLLMVYAPAIKRAHELGLQLYCGEFGCMPTPPREARLAYYRDIVSVFEANGIAWANWEYKGDFGIFEWHGPSGTIGAPDMEMIDALMSGACKCEATGNSLLK